MLMSFHKHLQSFNLNNLYLSEKFLFKCMRDDPLDFYYTCLSFGNPKTMITVDRK